MNLKSGFVDSLKVNNMRRFSKKIFLLIVVIVTLIMSLGFIKKYDISELVEYYYERVVLTNYPTFYKFKCNEFPTKAELKNILLKNSEDFKTFILAVDKLGDLRIEKTNIENITDNLVPVEVLNKQNYNFTIRLMIIPMRRCSNKYQLQFTILGQTEADKLLRLLNDQTWHGIPVSIVNN